MESLVKAIQEKVVAGKGKIIRPQSDNPNEVIVIMKNDLTAGNGERHDVLVGKGALCNEVTCNVFKLLQKKQHIPLAWIEQYGADSFTAIRCDMIPLEVVVRLEAAGSYLKRNPAAEAGDRFSEPLVEFYLKTTNQRFGALELPCDDPLLVHDYHNDQWVIHDPNTMAYIGVLGQAEASLLEILTQYEDKLIDIAHGTGVILEAAWARLDCRLQDFKVECGFGPDGQLLLADSIDCDSWRLVWQGKQLSKQPYRNGAPLAEVLMLYQKAAQLSKELA